MHTLADNVHIVTVLQPDADRYNTNPTTSYVNLGLYEEVTFVVAEGAGGTGTATLTVKKATDNTGTGATAIPFKYKTVTTLGTQPSAWSDATASGVAAAAGADKMVIVRVQSQDVNTGGPWVAMTLTEVVDSAVDAGVIALLSRPRYAQGNLLSPL